MLLLDPNLDGAGWFNDLQAPSFASSPTIRNTKFQANYAASEGGGFYTKPGPTGAQMNSEIRNTQFIRNIANLSGGGMYVGSFEAVDYSPQIRVCEFVSNEATRSGGGLVLLGDHAVIDSVTFRLNKATVISPDGSTRPG